MQVEEAVAVFLNPAIASDILYKNIIMHVIEKTNGLLLIVSFIFVTLNSFACNNRDDVNIKGTPIENEVALEDEVNVLAFRLSSKTDHEMIQKAIDYASANRLKKVFIPDGNYQIDAAGAITSQRGVSLRDNIHLRLSSKAVLMAIPNKSANYSILRINNVSNVKISGGIIKGERGEHLGKSGEWGMGIDINTSNNIEVENVLIEDCWGDGIYIGGTMPSKGILIDSVKCTNNRRQGLSVVNCDDLIIRNSVFSLTKGTSPQSGIDLEPNEGQTVKNVEIYNCLLEKNADRGLLMWGMHGSVFNVHVYNCIIDSNPVGVFMGYERVNNIELSNIKITNSTNIGIHLLKGAKDIDISNVEIYKSLKNAVTISKAADVNATGLIIKDYEQGVLIDSSMNVKISSSRLSSDKSSAIGVEMRNSKNVQLVQMSIESGRLGMSSFQVENLTVSATRLEGQSENALYLNETHDAVLEDNKFEAIGQTPIRVLKSNKNKIYNNSFNGNCYILDNAYSQIYLEGDCKANEFKKNTVKKGIPINKSKYVVWMGPLTYENTISENILESDSYHEKAIYDESGNNIIIE